MRLRTRLSTAGTALATALVYLGVVHVPTAAAAPGCTYCNSGPTGHGYQALAGYVSYSGNATGGGGSHSFRGGEEPFVPCVYVPSPADPATIADWAKENKVDGVIPGFDGAEFLGAYPGHRAPSAAEFEERRTDTSGGWYLKDCIPVEGTDYGSAYGIQEGLGQYAGSQTLVWVEPGQAPPGPPFVTPQMLIYFAEGELTLRAPGLQHSPAQKGVVRLPTAFWASPAGRESPLFVTAAVGPVSATVTATIDAMEVTATGPATQSVVCQDLDNEFADGAEVTDESCSVTFDRSGTYQISGTTRYTAEWTGAPGGLGGPLDPKTGPTQNLPAYPVVEVQVVN